MLGLTFSSKLDGGSSFISIAKTVSKKIEAFICSCFFLLRLLCIYKFTMRPCMEYCCDVWAGGLLVILVDYMILCYLH